MKIYLRKQGKAFVPCDLDGEALLNRLNQGEFFIANVIRPRSVPWHRMYFGLCKTIGENQDPPRDADSIDAELRILAGHYDVYRFGEHDVLVPKRIAFEKLTADEWADYWKRAELAVCERFGPEYITERAA